MKKQMLAMLLLVTVITSNSLVNTVYAMDSVGITTTDEIQVTDDGVIDEGNADNEQILSENENQIEEPNEMVGYNDEEQLSDEVSEAALSENRLSYVYIEKPYLKTPETQNIVVSWGNGTEAIDNMRITVRKEDGLTEEWACNNNVGQLYLFSREYLIESEVSTYQVVNVKFEENGLEQQFQLTDSNVKAEFGVNKEYEGIDELRPLDPEMDVKENLETSVVTIDENGETEEKDSIEKALSETAEETNVQNVPRAMTKTGERSGEIVVAIDPGHDSKHAGAAQNGLKEEVLTLKIAKYLKEELEQYNGVKVYMTRTEAACPYPSTGTSGACIKQRANAAAAAGAKIFVSLHLNSSPTTSVNGAEILIPNTNWKPQVAADGKALAEKILSELKAVGLSQRPTPIYSKDTSVGEIYPDGSKSDYFAVHIYNKYNNIPGIIIEHAFISNSNDVNSFLKTEAGLKKLGVADATGIAKFLGVSKGRWELVDGKWKYYDTSKGTYLVNQWISTNGKWFYVDNDGYRVNGWKNIGYSRYYFDENGEMYTGWLKLKDTWYYFGASGNMCVGWKQIGQFYYYFNNEGKMLTGWQDIGVFRYYFGPSGNMYVGWQDISGKRYYFGPSGNMYVGWQDISGKRYYFGASGNMYVGTQKIDGETYYFDNNGVLQKNPSGWKQEGSTWYYYNEDGNKAIGWKQIGQFYYYFNNEGKMLTGWQNIGIFRYYFGPSGNMYVGWQDIGGKRYYFGASGNMYVGTQKIDGETYYFDNNGVLQKNPSGWKQEGSTWYYYNEDGNKAIGWKQIGQFYYYFNNEGKMLTGWQNIGIFRYYFGPSGNMYVGWQDIGGKRYYFGASGNMYVGTQKIDGETYYFDNNGVLQKNPSGWKQEGSTWYYYNEDGNKAIGWKQIGQFYYYFNNEGKMLTGWQNIGIFRYYFGPSGNMYVGWQDIGGKRYYFGASGNMYVGTQKIDGETYYFDNNGVLQKNPSGWKQEGSTWYYYNEDGNKAIGWKQIGQFYYYFNNEGKMLTGWQNIGIFRYYFGPSGNMYVGWQDISGKRYYFGPSGNMYIGWRMVEDNYYYFNINGEMINQKPYLIMGESQKTKERLVAFFEKSGYKYPEELSKGGAANIEEFCQLYIEEATAEGVKAEVAFAQAMLETGYLKFGGDVNISQFNFAGLGATGNGVSGNTFPNVRIGIRAQIQHLKAYASAKPLIQECVDPRYQYVSPKGCAMYVEWLGQKENPDGKGWAASAAYGLKIMKLIESM